MVLSCLLLGLFEVPEFEDGLSIQIAEVGNGSPLFVPQHFLLDCCLFPMDEEGNDADLVEDVEVIGIVLMEGELQKEDDFASQVDVPQLARLIVGV